MRGGLLAGGAAFAVASTLVAASAGQPSTQSESGARRPSNPFEGPLNGCIASLRRDATPATAEWTWWLSGGGGTERLGDDSNTLAQIGAGGEVTFGLLRYRGFPSGAYGRRLGLGELRWGPWIAGATDFDATLAEAGLKLHLGAIYHASWGTFDLRAGGGYGVFDDRAAAHWTATLAY